MMEKTEEEKAEEKKNFFRKRAGVFSVLSAAGLFGVFCCIFTVYGYFAVERSSSAHVYSKDLLSRMPFYEYALVLGTSRKLKDGSNNLYFQYRMEAAVLLYREKKIRKILVSGDNRRKEYDEATDMKNALMEMGVAEKDILCDYAGLRTLDSVLRARNVFKLEKFLIVSQLWHCQRGVYIGRKHGLAVSGFAAKEIPFSYHYMGKVRELLARNKAVLDIWLNKKPYFEY